MTTFANFPYRDLWGRRRGGLCLALAALVLALSVRLIPAAGDRIWLLPLVVLALVPAALPGRSLVAAGAVLSILASLLILPDTDPVEVGVNGLLLAVCALLVGSLAEGVRRAHVTRLMAQIDGRWRVDAIGEMAAVLAHDLTQPLTAATAYLQAGQTELNRAGSAAGGTARTLDLVRAQLLRAGEVVCALRRRLDQQAPAPRPERVSDLVRALKPIMTAMGAAAGVAVTVKVDPRDDRVLADGIQIQQAMLNLVRNAIESVAGQTERTVIIRGRSISIEQYEVAVEDSGPGITAEEWSLSLQPSMSNAPDRRGLDLAVIRTILNRHGSDLSLRSPATGLAGFQFRLARVAESGMPA